MILCVQTYTIRRLMQENLETALKKLLDFPVKSIELARIKFNDKNIELVKKSGLNVVSMQVKFSQLRKNFQSYVSWCKLLNCEILVVSVLPLSGIIGGKAMLSSFTKKLNRLAQAFHDAGITLAFHHHDFEFKKISKITKFEYIVRHTTGKVKFVVDTYWVTKTNNDPVAIIRWLDDRLIGLHLRDHQSIKKGRKQIVTDCEIGSGTIDFEKVYAAAKKYAIYGAIEQNTLTPLESLQKSVDFLKAKRLESTPNLRSSIWNRTK